MQILSHRGLWLTAKEKNKKAAFNRSFDMGFGTETDLRDIAGKIVISHDMPTGDEISFEDVLEIMNGRNLPLALNIKADGLVNEILRILKKYNHTNYFTFDMSIPDMVVQSKTDIKFFTGMSDILKHPVLKDRANGIWLDCFNGDWYGKKLIDDLIGAGKIVCIVSSDLHGRNTDYQWNIIKESEGFNSDNLMLCTDKAQLAKEFFYGKN